MGIGGGRIEPPPPANQPIGPPVLPGVPAPLPMEEYLSRETHPPAATPPPSVVPPGSLNLDLLVPRGPLEPGKY